MTSLSSFTRLAAASAVLGTLALSAQAASIVKSSGATMPVLSEFGPAFANATNKTGYGGTQPDHMFVETFRLSCPKGQKVTKALFNIQVIKLTQGPNRGDNDALALWKGGPNPVYNTYLWQAADPAGTSKVVSLDLDALPPISTSSSPSGVINSPAGGHGLILVSNMSLSFSVQDDTMVKQASLEYACGLVKTDGGIGNAPSGGLLDGALVATEATELPRGPRPHIASWEIAGQFNPNNLPSTSSAPYTSTYEVWTYGYTDLANCSGPVIPFVKRVTRAFMGTTTEALQRGPTEDANDLPLIGQTSGPSLLPPLSPLRYSPGGLTMHPGPQGQCAVVRFTAPQTGKYRMMGRFWAQNVSNTGTETDTSVALNGGPLIPVVRIRALNPTSGNPSNHPFTSSVMNLNQGDTLDFRVGSAGSFLNDSTGLHGYIQRDDLP
jgi:hypothetical protein